MAGITEVVKLALEWYGTMFRNMRIERKDIFRIVCLI